MTCDFSKCKHVDTTNLFHVALLSKHFIIFSKIKMVMRDAIIDTAAWRMNPINDITIAYVFFWTHFIYDELFVLWWLLVLILFSGVALALSSNCRIQPHKGKRPYKTKENNELWKAKAAGELVLCSSFSVIIGPCWEQTFPRFSNCLLLQTHFPQSYKF